MSDIYLSIVIPCHNEEGNLTLLLQGIHAVLDVAGVSYEVIVTDDCSTDGSWHLLQNIAAKDKYLRAQKLQKNSGESAASWAGIQAARGQWIITMDADLQNNPDDLPAFLAAAGQADCICGSRVDNRSDGDHVIRVISSRIANAVRNALSGENISDAGCTYRMFRREAVANLKFFKGMHRFLPTLMKIEGFSVIEIPVSNNPRYSGTAHYGVWNRLFASFYDLLAVRWMKVRMFRFQIAERTFSDARE
ncbi:MAG TPA: glycosyltransferase family 2 protein [Pseudomonadales bacterium]|nr:glycosyltransferase family 2 protein [Pseudomonadales bacterium]